MHTRSRVFLFRSVLLLLPAVNMAVTADVMAQPTAFHACYVPLTGTVYRVREPNAGGSNEFIVRAAGGRYLFSNATRTSGVFLNPGAGAWGTASDVKRKHRFRDEDAESALAKVAAMRIRSWSYKSQYERLERLDQQRRERRTR